MLASAAALVRRTHTGRRWGVVMIGGAGLFKHG